MVGAKRNQPTQSGNGGEAANMAVGSSKRSLLQARWAHHVRWRVGLAGVLALILIVVIAGAAYYFVGRSRVKLPASASAASTQLYQQAAISSNPKVAQDNLNKLKQYAKNAKTPNDKAAYNSAIIQTALVARDYAQAQQTASTVNQESPSAGSAAMLAAVYLAQGNKQQAITYYKLAAARSPDPTGGPNARSERGEYLGEVAVIEGQQ